MRPEIKCIRYLLLILLVCSAPMVRAGNKEMKKQAALMKAAVQLDKALLSKDSVTLKKILHPALAYGHSNGWTETKQDVIHDLFNGELQYHKIETTALLQTFIKNGTGIVREKIKVEVSVAGTFLALELQVVQTWIRAGNNWQLVSRQSVKVN